MATSDAQKSEIHERTGDAGSSPTNPGDTDTTRRRGTDPSHHAPSQHEPTPLSPDTNVISDETDYGGPLVIESNDPDLNPPKVPIDPFPTERKPEIDPPVPKQ